MPTSLNSVKLNRNTQLISGYLKIASKRKHSSSSPPKDKKVNKRVDIDDKQQNDNFDTCSFLSCTNTDGDIDTDTMECDHVADSSDT